MKSMNSNERIIDRRARQFWQGFQARKGLVALFSCLLIAMVTGSPQISQAWGAEDEMMFGAAAIIIELTDNDIELQIFVDGEQRRVKVTDPNGCRIFLSKAYGPLRQQGGLSEMYFASEPTHFLEDEPDFDGTIEEFLARFPQGVYEFEGRTVQGRKVEGEATLTHILPALPEIIAPVSDNDEPPVVDPRDLVIDWLPVTTRFIGNGPVEIIEFQVIIEQVAPLRQQSWIDGHARKAIINVPGNVTSLSPPPEFFLPDALYDFEVLAIEASGNSSISTGEFMTGE